MPKPGRLVLSLLGLWTTVGTAQQDQKPNFSGSWQLNVAKSEIHASNVAAGTWLIEQRGLSIHVLRAEKLPEGKETKREFRCTADGKDCETDGIKISLWYDGNVLVEMDVDRETIDKYGIALAAGGKALTVELTHIVPGSDKEMLFFDKL
jgi:hypothetical protein